MGAPRFVWFRLAMGDRCCDLPPCIAWQSYSNSALLQTVQEITSVLQERLSAPATSRPETGTSGAQGSAGSINEQGLVRPWSCGFTCRWCASACTRKEGHTYHSCYEHRHRRRGKDGRAGLEGQPMQRTTVQLLCQ